MSSAHKTNIAEQYKAFSDSVAESRRYSVANAAEKLAELQAIQYLEQPYNLRDIILDKEKPEAEQVYRRFMWELIGHPDREHRDHEGRPELPREHDGNLYVYNKPLVEGWTANGFLVSLRSVEPADPEHYRDYFLTLGVIGTGSMYQPTIHHIKVEKGKNTIYRTIFQLTDPHAYSHTERFGHPRDQWRLVLVPSEPPELCNGIISHEPIRPIDELASVVNEALQIRDHAQKIAHKVGEKVLTSVY